MVVYGQGVWAELSGSKLMSNGRPEMSDIGRFVRSLSNFDVDWIYPAVARAGWSAVAQQSRMILCAIFLLNFLQLKKWSPYQSCCTRLHFLLPISSRLGVSP